MKRLKSIATSHPVVFVISSTIVWFVLLLILTAIASIILRSSYGDAVTSTVGRLVTTICVFFLIWRMGWLTSSGIARLGRWQAWLIALGGLVYFAYASLYSFYGEVAFNFSNLIRSSASHTTAITHFIAGLCEEFLFRGLVLYSLVRVWGNTKKGMFGSVALASLLFAVLHLMQVFTFGISFSSTLFLVIQTFIISIWWGALVLWGGSIWPAIMLHFAGNAVVAVQGLINPMIDPNNLAYRQLLGFSILLGVLGIGLLVQAVPRPVVPDVP